MTTDAESTRADAESTDAVHGEPEAEMAAANDDSGADGAAPR